MIAVPGLYDAVTRAGARNLFLDILRNYQMTPATRKKVESIAKFYAASRKAKPPKETAQKTYEALVDTVQGHAALAREIVNKGELCTHEDACQARCFRLVNTGHFDLKTMHAAQKVVDDAARRIEEAGFGRLCYGDVFITRTVAKGHVLAFYMVSEDRMYVRSNLKGEEGPAIATLIHELGHRLEFKFLPEKRQAIESLYRQYTRMGRGHVVHHVEPVVGAHITVKKTQWIITRFDRDKVYLQLAEDPTVTASMKRDGWALMSGAQREGDPFPSEYSTRSANELFAELFAGYVLGTLTTTQKHDFESLLR